MDLKTMVSCADIASKLATTIAIFIGGGMFFLYRRGVWNLEMNLSHEIIDYTDDLKLLMVKVSLKNIGRIKISSRNAGCIVAVKRLPQNLVAGQPLIWKDAGPDIIRVNILEQDAIYSMEPGEEHRGFLTLAVPKGQHLFIKSTFYRKKEDIEEYCITFVK